MMMKAEKGKKNISFPGGLCLLADPAGEGLQVGGAVFPAEFAGGGQHVEIRFLPCILGFRLSFGKPPAVGRADHPGIDAVCQVGNLDDPTIFCLDDNLVPLADTVFFCRFRVEFKPGMRPDPPQLFQPPVG